MKNRDSWWQEHRVCPTSCLDKVNAIAEKGSLNLLENKGKFKKVFQ
jgi:hypothetical protein